MNQRGQFKTIDLHILPYLETRKREEIIRQSPRSRRVRLHIPKRSTVKVAEAESKERRKAEGGERLFLHCRFPCSVETRGYAGWSHANARHVHTGFTRIFINCAPA